MIDYSKSGQILLLTDGSVDTISKTGYGAYLIIDDILDYNKAVHQNVITKRFENTSSSKLELQTLLWALTEIVIDFDHLIICTDSQNIINLPGRRARLEKNQYLSAKNKLLANHKLYMQFYQLMDKMKFQLIKIKGHQPSSLKNETDQLFSLVDKAARKALKDSQTS